MSGDASIDASRTNEAIRGDAVRLTVNGLLARSVERTIIGEKEGAIMDAVIIEIRAAEGGDDAKLLVQEQMAIYLKLAGRRSL